MKITASAVVGSAIGVLVAGLALYYLGKFPVIEDARKGFDGRAS